jgi:hypothetical protein
MPVALPIAVVGAAGIGAAASISASNKASKTAKAAADANNALQERIYGENKAVLSPYVQAGNTATSAIQALLGLDKGEGHLQRIEGQREAYDTWRNATGYQDQFAEGQRAVTGALGNRGLLDSGAAQKALTRYGQGVANQSFGQYYNMLAGQQAVGLTGASAQAGVGQNFASSVSNNNIYSANAQGNAALTNANSINGILQSGLSAYALSRGLGSSYGGAGGGLFGGSGGTGGW